jgi:divalent metal cation (Fe/Co/Zn/Cd) transporter
MAEASLQTPNRADLVKRGLHLEYFTIGYNSLEGLIALVAGLMAGSIALVSFGFDSLLN